MEGSVFNKEGPVVDNVSALSVDSPHLSGKGGSYNVLVAIAVHVKEKGCGCQRGVAEVGGPQLFHTEVTSVRKREREGGGEKLHKTVPMLYYMYVQ